MHGQHGREWTNFDESHWMSIDWVFDSCSQRRLALTTVGSGPDHRSLPWIVLMSALAEKSVSLVSVYDFWRTFDTSCAHWHCVTLVWPSILRTHSYQGASNLRCRYRWNTLSAVFAGLLLSRIEYRRCRQRDSFNFNRLPAPPHWAMHTHAVAPCEHILFLWRVCHVVGGDQRPMPCMPSRYLENCANFWLTHFGSSAINTVFPVYLL